MPPSGPDRLPDLTFERAISAEFNISLIAGVDEAGRGALAGPVFAAAVQLMIPNNHQQEILTRLSGIQDSKLLSPKARERFDALIRNSGLAYAVAHAPTEYIDQNGILNATRWAMTEAVRRLLPPAQAILVDGPLRLVSLSLPQRPVVRGDRQSLAIAAASILAKVGRDRYMIALDEQFPEYGFARHKGYGTAEHLAVLGRLGPCPEHRLSFAPLRTGLF